MNKKAALSLSKHGACVARVITMTEQLSTQRQSGSPQQTLFACSTEA